MPDKNINKIESIKNIISKNIIENLKTEDYEIAIDSIDVDDLEILSESDFEQLINECSKFLDDFEISEFNRIKNKHSYNDVLSYRKEILLNLQALISSHNSRYNHKLKLSGINLNLISDNKSSSTQLEPIEIFFLYKINGKDTTLQYVPQYFTYDYNLKYQETLNKLYSQGYLSFANISYSLNKLNIDKLREILKTKELLTKGKKQELINIIMNNFTIDEIYNCGINSYFLATDKGTQLINTHKALILYYSAFKYCSWTSPDEIIAIELLHPDYSDAEILCVILENYISTNPKLKNDLATKIDLDKIYRML